MKARLIIFTLALAGINFLTAGSSVAQNLLFKYPEPLTASALTNEPAPVLSRNIVDPDLSSLENGFVFNTPGGAYFPALSERKSVFKNHSGSFTRSFSGRLISSEGASTEGYFSLSVTGAPDGSNALSGSFLTPDGSKYRLYHDAESRYPVLSKIDESLQLDCRGSAHAHKHLKNGPDKLPALAAGSGAGSSAITIRVLVAYTPDAVTVAGSPAAVESIIAGMMANTNMSHANALTGISFVLAGTYALSENSSGNYNTDLNNATDTNDGKWDILGTLRDQKCADMVSVVVGEPDGGQICGLAWLGGNAADMPLYKGLMFSIVSSNEIMCSDLRFPHELAHNLGSQHDLASAGSVVPAYNFSYGYRFTGLSSQSFRTVMGVAPGGSLPPGIRVPYFSSPLVTFDGVPVGTSLANNAESLRLTAPVVAAFYPDSENCSQGGTPEPGTPSLSPDKVNLKTTVDKKKNQLTFKGTAKLSGTTLQNIAVSLFYDKKKKGLFVKVIRSGSTGKKATFSYKKSVSKLSTGFYRLCYTDTIAGSQICSAAKKVTGGAVKKKRKGKR